jgi:hypothetical protein
MDIYILLRYTYILIIGLISFLVLKNALSEKDLQRQFIGFFVLLPFLLRFFLVK